MTQKKDKLLEEYLAGNDSLSSMYSRGEQPEPPRSMDKSILDAAHASVKKKTAGINPFTGSWFMPAAMAAVLILAVGIVVTMENEVGTDFDEADQWESNQPRSNDFQQDSDSTAGVAPKLKPAPTLEKNFNARKRQSESVKSKPDAKPKPAMKMKSRMQSEEKESRSLKKQQAPKLLLEEAGVLEPAPSSESAPAPSSESAPAPSSVSAPAGKGMMDTAPAGKGMMDTAPAEIQSAPETEKNLLKREVSKDKTTELEKPLSPEAWLNKIQALQDSGELEAASAEIDLFKKAYPDYKIPDQVLKDYEK